MDAWFPTCNIAFPRALLERLGGFDEDFPTAWGEDTDLGLRAIDAGGTVFYVADALSYHAVNARTLPQALREAWRRDSLPMVFARHPRQRRALFMDTFVRRTHANFLLALAGVAIVRRRPLLGLLAMLPYLRNRRPLPVAAAQRPADPRPPAGPDRCRRDRGCGCRARRDPRPRPGHLDGGELPRRCSVASSPPTTPRRRSARRSPGSPRSNSTGSSS